MKLSVLTMGVGLMLIASVSCKRSAQSPAELQAEDTTMTDSNATMKDDLNKSKTIIYTLPAPVEMASIIQESGVRFDDQILNDLGASSRYSTNCKMALNLGIYSMDMSMSGMFNQSQRMVEYYNTIKSLANNLGISKLLDDEAIKKLESSNVTKDEALGVISEVYMNTNQYLIENNRRNISALVMAGGWIEGIYLAMNYFDPQHLRIDFVQRIIAQKLTLATMFNIIDSMDANGTDEDLAYVREKLEEIKTIFDSITLGKEGKISAETDYDTKTTVIKANPTAEIDLEVLSLFKAKVIEVRNEFVN